MNDNSSRPVLKLDADLFKYLLIDLAGICVAMYFLLGETQPELMQAWGLPVLIQGIPAYITAGIAVMAGAMPLLGYFQRKVAEARGVEPPSQDVM